MKYIYKQQITLLRGVDRQVLMAKVSKRSGFIQTYENSDKAYIRQLIVKSPKSTGSFVPSRYFGKSFIKILNKAGLRLSPCLTPQVQINKIC